MVFYARDFFFMGVFSFKMICMCSLVKCIIHCLFINAFIYSMFELLWFYGCSMGEETKTTLWDSQINTES